MVQFRRLWSSLGIWRLEDRARGLTRADPGLQIDGTRDSLVAAADQEADALTLNVITTAKQLRKEILSLKRNQCARPLLCELWGGLDIFTSTAFPSVDAYALYAKRFDREPTGRGAHFDVYGDLLDPEFPYIGIFNVVGDASIGVFRLPDSLAQRYFALHPQPTDAAYDTRRQLAAEALADSSVRCAKGRLHRGSGFILPQFPIGPQWVHEIVPLDPGTPGRFVKLAVPAANSEARRQLIERGYMPLFLARDGIYRWPDPRWASTESGTGRPRHCNLD